MNQPITSPLSHIRRRERAPVSYARGDSDCEFVLSELMVHYMKLGIITIRVFKCICVERERVDLLLLRFIKQIVADLIDLKMNALKCYTDKD